MNRFCKFLGGPMILFYKKSFLSVPNVKLLEGVVSFYSLYKWQNIGCWQKEFA
jgi:hypothetical protein